MRAAWLAPAALLLTGCGALDPTAAYREAARRLQFRLESVRPRLELALPLERSALVLGLDLAVDNPSDLRLGAKALAGTVHLDVAEGSFPLGQVQFPSGVDLPPRTRPTVKAEVRLPYKDLARAWRALESVALRGGPGAWRLEGTATVDLLGISLDLPLRSVRRTGPGAP